MGYELIAEIFRSWMDLSTASPETQANVEFNVSYFVKWALGRRIRYWKDLRLEHLQSYAANLVRDGKKIKTIKHYCQPVKTCSRWAALNWPDQFRDFAAGFKYPKMPSNWEFSEGKSAWRLEEVCEFILWLMDREDGWSVLPGVALQGLVGLRVTEALRLTWDKIDLGRGTATIEGQVKNIHSVRRILLPFFAVEVLRMASRSGERVLPNYAQYDAYGRNLRRLMREWRPERLIPPSDLRDVLETEADLIGRSGFVLDRYLGHAPKTIGQKNYAKPSQSDLEKQFSDQILSWVNERTAPFAEKGNQKGRVPKLMHLR